MINGILGFMLGPIECIIALIMCGVMFGLPIWFIRCLVKNKRENQRLRLEVGKLADELERLRKNNEGNL